GEGKKEGAIEALQKALLEQLEERFGEVSAATRASVKTTSSTKQLRLWMKRFAKAKTLEDVQIGSTSENRARTGHLYPKGVKEKPMTTRDNLGGIIHTYQKFDPLHFPSPTVPPPDLVSPAFEHLLAYGNTRRLTEEELARAVRIDPSQIKGLGPTIDALMAMLLERKRKILETYETGQAEAEARQTFHDQANAMKPPWKITQQFKQAVREEQLHDLEQLWYRTGDEHGAFARQLVHLVERLGEKYQVDELAAKYEFTGRTPMNVPKALEVKA